MRLRRLDLVRYGKFTDFTIDFGEASPGRPDLHVVYGANEAGKSTTLAAWLDLLFGIPMQSGYGFLHPYSTMRIDALIESVDGAANGGARAFTRIKRPANSLLDDKGQPLAEAALRGALGNLTRETYCQMFSLDDETLEKGGEEILTSKGDLGQLLFAASAGLGGLSARLKQTQEEAEQIYKKGGSKNLIADRKRQLAELAERRKALDTMAGAYQELKRQAHEAVAAHEAADAERRAIAAAA
ncbi:MAG: AAA family ATPase, partial [Hyphomonas sp.]|nr:AAA family ATPase [Hyphomonas sp.]